MLEWCEAARLQCRTIVALDRNRLAAMGRRIVDLHDVLTRILRVYGREAAAMWLVGSEPLLGGARPIDILVLEGAAPVIRAIDGISQGAYA
jgi:uncharacterized protein (DUF2384 family)